MVDRCVMCGNEIPEGRGQTCYNCEQSIITVGRFLQSYEEPKKCKLCSQVWPSKEAYVNTIGDHWEEECSIVIDDDKPWLYVPVEMDFYYSDTYLQIDYCPKCGRKLTEENDG